MPTAQTKAAAWHWTATGATALLFGLVLQTGNRRLIAATATLLGVEIVGTCGHYQLRKQYARERDTK